MQKYKKTSAKKVPDSHENKPTPFYDLNFFFTVFKISPGLIFDRVQKIESLFYWETYSKAIFNCLKLFKSL
jgi:hypothetical protein